MSCRCPRSPGRVSPLKVIHGPDEGQTLGEEYAEEGLTGRIEDSAAAQEDFNLSTARSTTVLELAEVIWKKLKGDQPFRYECDDPFAYDVQRRVPATDKASRVLGFEATVGLEEALDEIIPWIREELAAHRI